ncbi:hypothetical protein [Stenotrophomonas sp. PA-6-5C]|uniref:DinB/UmuC family translesion DNA polymerase n=1 Tax=Stenotrophomonas sp. PA-6-5C TaxID=2665487 RepID=UPI001F42D013|nr:hypothetical protein [Stenotrophomonas sp. PA-6-5C]
MTALPGSALLERFPVEDVWGAGRKLTARLGIEGVLTAADLVHADSETLRARYGVTLARTQRELWGIACSSLEEVEPDRQQIVVSRSFGKEVVALEALQQAVATFAQRACETLRGRSLQAGGDWVFLHTNPFKPGAPQYHPSKAPNFISPTTDTREVLMVVQALTNAMWREDYRYKKAGIGLLDLTARDVHQGDLFAQVDPRSQALTDVMDRANAKFGRGAMAFASSAKRVRGGEQRRQVWAMNHGRVVTGLHDKVGPAGQGELAPKFFHALLPHAVFPQPRRPFRVAGDFPDSRGKPRAAHRISASETKSPHNAPIFRRQRR